MGPRRRGRVLAVQALYAWDFSRGEADSLAEFPWIDEKEAAVIDDTARSFGRLLLAGTVENIDAVDEAIRKKLEHWDFQRINKVDLAVLRMSVYCLLFVKDIPPSVVIDEAVDIAKDFGTDDSYRFINGVLDGIRKNRESGG